VIHGYRRIAESTPSLASWIRDRGLVGGSGLGEIVRVQTSVGHGLGVDLLDPSFDFAAVYVEEPSGEVGADKEIVDFGIHDPDRCVLAVQVKSGVAGSEMRARCDGPLPRPGAAGAADRGGAGRS
jgi:hypothetical protein